jgi:hypothetical protein
MPGTSLVHLIRREAGTLAFVLGGLMLALVV